MSRTTLLLAACMPFLHTVRVDAQILEDWQLLASDRAFDYLIAPRASGPVDPQGADSLLLRVTASRMLVRYIDDARAAVIAVRRADRAATTGYGRYASSTWLLNVRCADRSVSIVEVTDFDDDGNILDRRRLETRWSPTVDQWDPTASARLIAWSCDRNRRTRQPIPIPGRIR